jgi:hypothetical protein
MYPVAAQQQPATIPTDLALALLGNSASVYGSRTPRITVGQAPAGVPASLTAADGGVVLGGVEFPERATVVLAFTLPATQVLAAYDKQLLARGWAPPPPPANERGGFVSADFSFPGGNVYCADSGVAMISSVPAPGGGTYLRVQHMRNKDRSVCNPRLYTPGSRMPHLAFPTLRSPVGMSQRGGGGCTGSDRTEISAHLVGAGEPLDILTHYVKQLESAGWKVGTPVSADGLAVATTRTKDSDGVDWSGAMTVTRVTSAEVEVTIQMMRPSER